MNTGEAERRAIFARILTNIGRPMEQLDDWVTGSPLVRVTFPAAWQTGENRTGAGNAPGREDGER